MPTSTNRRRRNRFTWPNEPVTERTRQSLKLLDKLIKVPITFGLCVKSIRETDELTQSDLAAKLGISVQHLSNVENGRKSVSIERAEAWAKALGYPEEMFVQLALQDQFQRAGLEGYEVAVRRVA